MLKYFTLTLAAIAALVAAGALAVALTGPTKADVAHVRSSVAQLHTSVDQLQGVAALNDTTTLDNEVRKLNECAAELEGQLTGASVTGSYLNDPNVVAGQNTELMEYPPTFSLGAQLSQDCSALLNPTR